MNQKHPDKIELLTQQYLLPYIRRTCLITAATAPMLNNLKNWARKIKNDLVAVFLAGRDRRTPLKAKYIAIAVAAYALSPIDLIPDFIPVLGYLDDLILVPAGIALVVKLIPAPLLAELRSQALKQTNMGKNWMIGSLIIVLWLAGVVLLGYWAIQ